MMCVECVPQRPQVAELQHQSNLVAVHVRGLVILGQRPGDDVGRGGRGAV
jgi:hypothetical protein